MAGDQRAGRGHADEDGAGPGADAGAGFLAQRGVRLVADDDRVGVRDFLVVADEPLVGLDRDRAFGVVAVAEQRRAQALLVAAVGDLADELVDQVAAVGEDEDAAGAGRLDEADRGHGLARAGRVLEPEAARRAGVVGGLLDDLVFVLRTGFRPVLRLLVLGLVGPSSSSAPSGAASSTIAASAVSGSSTPAFAVRELDPRPRRSRPGPGPSARPGCRRARRPDAARARPRHAGSAARPRGSAPARAAASSCGATRSRAPRRRPPARRARRRAPAGGRCRARAPRAPRRRAGTARGRTTTHARYRRQMGLPRQRQHRWCWP